MLLLRRNLIQQVISQAIKIFAFVTPTILLTETLCNYEYLIYSISIDIE